MINLWHDFLYQPLFNFLIWIYNNWTDQNLGLAIVYLTVLLRLVLLPFTLVTEKTLVENKELEKDVARLEKELGKDHVLKKQEIRRALKRRKVRPWAKVVVLGVQFLVLVLLYQVFLRGITGEKILDILYPFVDFPGKMNTDFFGFNLLLIHDIIWPGIVAMWLFFEIYLTSGGTKGKLNRNDLLYFLLFPAAIFIVLYMLPLVKSLFVLTSLVFSAIVHQFSAIFFKPKTEEEKP